MRHDQPELDHDSHYLHVLQDYLADGILFAGGGVNEPGHPERLEVAVRSITQPDQPDNFGGARQMTEYLLARGHWRIAFVMGLRHVAAANVCLQGHTAALESSGISVEQALLLPGDFDLASGERAVDAIARVAPRERLTTVFAANDETAFGVLIGLAQLGLLVPRDLSVCGFGDLPMAQFVVPSLTTVCIALGDLGRAGARTLLALMRHAEETLLEVSSTSIIERESPGSLA